MKRINKSTGRWVDWRREILWALIAVFALLCGLHLAMPASVLAQGPARVDVAHLDGAIDVFTQGYIERVVGVAASDGAQALIIQMDTPGGRIDAMEGIVKAILASHVPVVVYVAPAGSDAGSAGTFITYSAHLAAMAPGTRIGAAHPVDSSGGDITGTEGIKVLNDSITLIQSLARQHGRNVDWATKAVSESASLTAQDALQLHVVNFVAMDVPDLLRQMDGRQVPIADGSSVTLHTNGAPTHDLDMTIIEQFFQAILDPNIAAVLLTVGGLAITVEIFNPGATLPGVTGVICLTLAFVSLYNLPTNWAALILILAAIIMFVLDVKVNSFVLTLGGIVSFVLGALFLFRPLTPPEPTMPVVGISPFVIAVLVLFMAAFFVFIMSAAVRSRNVPVVTGLSPFMGASGVATSELTPGGTAWVRGEDWTVTAEEAPIHKGERIKVVGIEGLHLRVIRVNGDKPEKRGEIAPQA